MAKAKKSDSAAEPAEKTVKEKKPGAAASQAKPDKSTTDPKGREQAAPLAGSPTAKPGEAGAKSPDPKAGSVKLPGGMAKAERSDVSSSAAPAKPQATPDKAEESDAFKKMKAGLNKPAALGGAFAKPFAPPSNKGKGQVGGKTFKPQVGRSGTNTGVPRRTGGG